jgi:hypothetical protein
VTDSTEPAVSLIVVNPPAGVLTSSYWRVLNSVGSKRASASITRVASMAGS